MLIIQFMIAQTIFFYLLKAIYKHSKLKTQIEAHKFNKVAFSISFVLSYLLVGAFQFI